MEINDTSVEVLYDFEYPLNGDKKVTIKEGERLFLIKKTNDDWWQVIRSNERRPFYVPSTYVREILPARRSSTSSINRSCSENKFIVSVNVKPKPVVVAKPRISKATSSYCNIKVTSNNDGDKDQRDNKVINSSELSENDKRSGAGYSIVRVKKTVPEYGEANILEEEQQLSESLTELARQITFRPAGEPRHEFIRRLDGLKYAGSFKTKHERRKILDRQLSGSWPDLSSCDRSENKSMEQLEDSENNLVDRPSVTVVTFPGNNSDHSNNNWRHDDSDSERLGSDITESSCESLNPTKYKPVAKPRRVYKPQPQEEVIYANCLELRALENDEASKELNKASDSLKENSEPESIKEVVKEPSPPKEFIREPFEQEFIKDLENKTALIFRQHRSSSGEYEEEKGQIERNENEKSTEETDWGRKFFKKEKKRKASEKENEIKGKETEKRSSRENLSQDSRETPVGWTTHVDTETQLPCYIHSATGKKWYSSTDSEGREYFFEEHGVESSWTLPDLSNPPSRSPTALDTHQISEELTAVFQKISASGVDPSRKLRHLKAVSMIVPDKREENNSNNVNKDWPELNDGKICILLEGPLNYTKISESGKKVRKSWSPAYVILTELFILIYKDMKSFHSQKTSPEVTIDLNGAKVGNGQNVSGRKHVILVSTLLGYDFALQCENVNSVLHWATTIQTTIKNLFINFKPKGVEGAGLKFSGQLGDCPEEPRKSGTGISRSKSVNFKNKDDSMEDLGSTPAERQLKIKARLKKFFHKRPSMEHLVKKGIYKDEPVFGCFLEQACGNNTPRVPPFVQKCIAIIETEENMKTDGLYRASGNLSQIQKIRFQIDQHNYSCLEQEEDVHVLTGALKLFFRELKEPLIPYKLFPKAIQASMVPERKSKIKQFQEIVKALPTPNRDTLKCLLQHLLKVSEYKESNRMHINNVAIVFGPTLMWPEHESVNMALDMMQQNMVIESLLNDYDVIFK